MAFVRRIMTATFQLGVGDFGTGGQAAGDVGTGGFNTVTLSGLRMSAAVEQAGGLSMGKLHLRIWGMPLKTMNKLSLLGQKINTGRFNVVTVNAGNEGETPGVVFKGTINEAYSDFNAAPDVSFEVLAQSMWFESVTPGLPISIRGSADVANLLSGLAKQMGMAFENNGVTAKLSNPYYGGSLKDQATAIVRDAGIEWNVCDGRTLAIWPKGGSRGGVVPLISPATGMIGYPVYTPRGLIVRTIYNPSISFGANVKVESSLEPATGTWVVYKLDHKLMSLVPKGAWETIVHVALPGSVVVA